MSIPSSNVRRFTPDGYDQDSEKRLKIFETLKSGTGLCDRDIVEKARVSPEFLGQALELFVGKGLIDIVEGRERKIISFKETRKGFLGVSFTGANCDLSLIDTGSNVSERENIFLPTLSGAKGRMWEFKQIVKELGKGTRLRGAPIYAAGVVVSEQIALKNVKSLQILSEGVSRLFGCRVVIADQASAGAYAEKEGNADLREKDILYMHTDSGDGVVVKKETIHTKKSPGHGPASYLRPWGQFNAVKTAKHLVNKGLGTDIVTMAKGNAENITIDMVLAAAEKKDELAGDLVKRSALAMGVRAAYLINVFDLDVLVLGGGIEEKEGGFSRYVDESMRRFLMRDKVGKIAINSGTKKEGAYCTGAAMLCRRELYMEG